MQMHAQRSAQRKRSRYKLLIQTVKRCTKKLISFPKSAYRKVKSGLLFARRKASKLFRRSKKKGPSAGSGVPASMRALSTSAPSSRMHAISSTITKPIETDQGKPLIFDESSDIITGACEYICAVEAIIREFSTGQIDARVPLALLSHMRASGMEVASDLSDAERRCQKRAEGQKGAGASRKMPSNKIARTQVCSELEPNLVMKRFFTKTIALRKSYMSMHKTVVDALAMRSPCGTHTAEDAALFCAAMRQVKAHVLDSICRVNKACPVFMHTYKRQG
ncbi:uncharacterized protein NEMAJ01_1068 [Nematocida major]|uniref:uncharacterized protein n=1 Tax=Nematocida major TaxID=1912982 RepID=UPI002007602F|nr:uncharacterized protein NEMAJ01_1068 [Nematocida major]KAH9386172.1 hypothetical protein NEMAJ01_1068 [Nematocida major]